MSTKSKTPRTDALITLGWIGEPIELARTLERALAAKEAEVANAGLSFLFAWMSTPNPMLGDISPLHMLWTGRGVQLAKFIEQAKEDYDDKGQPR